MSAAIPQYLRSYRKRTGLTQSDVASLLGLDTGESVSKYERLARRPTLETAFALQHVFNVPADELFPGLYREVEQGVRDRARRILKKQGTNDRGSGARKRALLEALASTKRT